MGTINPEKALLYITKQLWKDWVQICACHLSHFKTDPSPIVRRFSDSAFLKLCLSDLPVDWLVIQLICGALPHPGIKPGSSALQEDSLPSEPPGGPWGSRWHQRGRRKPNKSFPPNHVFVFRGVLHHTALSIAAQCSWGHSTGTPQWLLLFCLTIRCLLLC